MLTLAGQRAGLFQCRHSARPHSMPTHYPRSESFRDQLEELGLSQAGFARTMMALGDPSPFNVLLHWTQRMSVGLADSNNYAALVLQMLREKRAHRAVLRRSLELLLSGQMRSGQDVGRGWEDTTEASIEETRAQIALADHFLKECEEA